MKNRWISLALAVIMLSSATAAALAENTSVGVSRGFGGDVTAEVTTDDNGNVIGLTVTAEAETPAIGGAAVEPLTAAILEKGSADVDGVAGATITSNAVKAAVNAALTGAAPAAEQHYAPGTYTGTAGGRGGDITVEVTVTEDAITAVEIKDASLETPGISDMPLEKVPDEIVTYQSLGLDAVTGATLTSYGVLNAAANALKQAGADVAALRAVPAAKEVAAVEDMTAQVVVAGGGMAGLMAAVTAADHGADVVLVEKLPYLGGTLLVAAGGLVVSESEFMADHGIDDSIENVMGFVHAVNDTSIRQPDYDFIEHVLLETGVTTDYMDKGLGIDMMPLDGGEGLPDRVMIGGARWGAGYVDILENLLQEKDVRVLLNTSAQEILMDDGKAVGLRVSADGGEFTIAAQKVILATGGASYDTDRLIAANPGLIHTGLDEQACIGNTGDGFRMLEEIGAHMGEGPFVKSSLISFSPVFRLTWLTVPSLVNNMIFDANGIRFVNESISKDAEGFTTGVNTEMIRHGSRAYYALFDTHNISEQTLAMFGQYAGQDNPEIVVHGKDIHEIAQKLGVDDGVLSATYARYQAACEKGLDVDRGKDASHLIAYNEDGGLYAARIMPGSIGTIGGVLTDESFRVLAQDGSVIENVFAAGEVATSTLYGDYYMGAFSLGFYATAGRIAAETAVGEL